MNKESTNKKGILHLVFFWLKNPDNKNDRIAFENALNKLLQNSVILKNVHFGKPVEQINRPVVDTSYSYCLKVNFDIIDEHNNYQKEKSHKIFISEASELWEKVVIYDSESFTSLGTV